MVFGQKDESLGQLVERLNQLEWEQSFLMTAERQKIVEYLLHFYTGHQKYLGFELAQADFRHGARLFTGERLRTQLGLNYVLSLEICRQFRMMDGFTVETGEILEAVEKRLQKLCFVNNDCTLGECAYCGLAFWRYLLVSGRPDRDARVRRYLDVLRTHRDGNGRWKQFPFYFTLLVLFETKNPQADEELA